MFIKVAAVAQVTFQLVCPEAGFIENDVNTVECTVRGSDVKGAPCAFAVPVIRLETVDSGVPQAIAQSPFPTCDNNWSSVNNDNGRCADRDTNTDIYTYQFKVTADRAFLTSLTVLRCFAECSFGPGLGNQFTYNTSETCGPPVIFAAPEPRTQKSISNSQSSLVIGLGVAGGVFVVMAAVFSGVYCIRKPRSPGGQQNAPPADALPANFPPDNAPLHNAPLHNAPPQNAPLHNDPLHNAPPQNAFPAADSAGPWSGQTVPTTPDDEPSESSFAGSEASEASEGAEDSASDVTEVFIRA
ncbi:hypothetical protein V1264_017581 [Littorina saxatilis]|uniref:Uncharacterized protein n=1 Tax=Littorina saxatilis TaxID=31220 RepID=A0AAN9BJW5_9CAEN